MGAFFGIVIFSFLSNIFQLHFDLKGLLMKFVEIKSQLLLFYAILSRSRSFRSCHHVLDSASPLLWYDYALYSHYIIMNNWLIITTLLSATLLLALGCSQGQFTNASGQCQPCPINSFNLNGAGSSCSPCANCTNCVSTTGTCTRCFPG